MGNNSNQTKFNTEARPNWCPGCGNYGIQAALKKALLNLDLEPHQVVMSTGIGCSSKIPHWVNVYGLHGLHGRALPLAAGIKLANHNLVVIAEGGDGDGLSEGMGHFIQAARRNIDLTYIIHNNGVFALTAGQTSATGKQGFISSSTPFGSIEPPFSPTALAVVSGATFVAAGYSGDIPQLAYLIAEAIKHRGFSYVNVMQVCVSYNPEKSYQWYKDRIYSLNNENYDAADRNKALEIILNSGEDRLATGIIYQSDKPSYESSLPQIQKFPLVEHDINNIDISKLMTGLI